MVDHFCNGLLAALFWKEVDAGEFLASLPESRSNSLQVRQAPWQALFTN
jgi:hypothetical protein